ncbi:Glycosyltransferase involved in cell wall bisynthesis [Lentzea xinjiangensis]|uniref:Glycosyltransferase involved in cell wall bisynthesis n=1 Tax=Lentzea xinjiangensis TaxID=402600 RepID=A0A1H9W019_9PSEU|nr:glycosyltransferase family 4 protein [Lentzea xinjiangensis]SES27232.1 Glycosyltransferase involved in cell wall bisynthesis [Lentzea xinjiangensis]
MSALSQRALPRLAGVRILVLNWRDVRHPESGGAETYIHETTWRFVAAGAHVTLLTARPPGQSAREQIDGVDVHRAGGTLTVYLCAAWRMLRTGRRYDVVLDCQNGIPFFAPLFLRIPVVQVVHHVHQDQFATRFPPVVAAVGRRLEADCARWVYRGKRSVAVSVSTRQEMRARLRVDGVIDIVPNGGVPFPQANRTRAEVPTVVLVARLVPHKRVDVLLHAVAQVRAVLPQVRVEIIGGGSELGSLRELSGRLGLTGVVTLHGRVSDDVRDALLGRAWVTTSTSDGEGWGCSVLEAAAAGVPCVALEVPGIRDSVLDGRTGWLVAERGPAAFAAALVTALTELANPDRAAAVAGECRRWARRFTWDRSAELLAASVLAARCDMSRNRRKVRPDMTTLAWFIHDDPPAVLARLRLTDEVAVAGNRMAVVLRGCDDLAALALLEELGASEVRVRTAGRHEVLAGPDVAARSAPGSRASIPGTCA